MAINFTLKISYDWQGFCVKKSLISKEFKISEVNALTNERNEINHYIAKDRESKVLLKNKQSDRLNS